MTTKAEKKKAQDERYEKMSRKELQEEMATVMTGSIMKLVEQVVEQRVKQWIEVVADKIQEMEKASCQTKQ